MITHAYIDFNVNMNTRILGIVEKHGGQISVYSGGMNRGSTFTILLPMYQKVYIYIYMYINMYIYVNI
jgi:glutamate formiminotransferase